MNTSQHTPSTPPRPNPGAGCPVHPQRAWLRASVLALACTGALYSLPAQAGKAIASTPPARGVGPAPATTTSVLPSADVLAMHHWVRQTGDNGQGPFMVLDKRHARLWVFDRNGRTVATSPVLLGAAVGDDSVPGIGERPMAQILPQERTTPAGRYWAEPGVNAHGEDIFWVDYDAAVSMHRVRSANAAERRLERLATPTEADNRISYGCINVPAAFYDATVRPMFTQAKGWIYVLPETRPVQTLFKSAATAPAG